MIRKTLPLLLRLSLGACDRTAEPPLGSGETAEQQAAAGLGDRVLVLAADAMVIDGRHVRLANAFAPQGMPDARCWAEAVAAQQAVLMVRDRVREARAVAFTPGEGKDEYDRDLGLVTLDGVDLGQALFDSGVAARRGARRFDWCAPVSRDRTGAPPLKALLDMGLSNAR